MSFVLHRPASSPLKQDKPRRLNANKALDQSLADSKCSVTVAAVIAMSLQSLPRLLDRAELIPT